MLFTINNSQFHNSQTIIHSPIVWNLFLYTKNWLFDFKIQVFSSIKNYQKLSKAITTANWLETRTSKNSSSFLAMSLSFNTIILPKASICLISVNTAISEIYTTFETADRDNQFWAFGKSMKILYVFCILNLYIYVFDYFDMLYCNIQQW